MTKPILAALGLALALTPGLHAQDISSGVGSFPRTEDVGSGVGSTPLPPPVQTQPATTNLLASDPEAIQAAMMAEGFQAKLERRENGSTVITGRISNSNYWLYFENCDDGGRNCRSLQFHSGYTLDTPPSLEALNQFSQDYKYIRVYRADNGDVFMKMDLLMREDGIGRENFARYLAVWVDLMGFWEEFLDV